MELHQLEYFIAVAEEASFTKAAVRLNVAQPGVSAQVRRLEAELGQPLLDRSQRTIKLTSAGEAVLPHARAALDAAANARLSVDELAGLVRGRVTIGMVGGCASPILPALLAEFHALHPGVSVTLSEDTSDRLIEAVRDGRLDLALIGSAGESPPGVAAVVVADEPLVAAVRPDHHLAKRKTITVDALAEQPLISLPRGTGARAALDAACASASVTVQIAFEVSALPILAQLATLGLGAAILPASTAHAHQPSLRVLHITAPTMRSRLELIWSPRTAGNPAARTLTERIRAFVTNFNTNPQSATK